MVEAGKATRKTLKIGSRCSISVAGYTDSDNEIPFFIDSDNDCDWISKEDAEKLIEHLKNVFNLDS